MSETLCDVAPLSVLHDVYDVLGEEGLRNAFTFVRNNPERAQMILDEFLDTAVTKINVVLSDVQEEEEFPFNLPCTD